MELFTWEFLLTFAGCSAATAVLVQLFKKYVPMPTQILTYIVAFVVFNVAALVLSTWAWPVFGIAFFNAGIVSLASNGGYEAACRLIAGKKE